MLDIRLTWTKVKIVICLGFTPVFFSPSVPDLQTVNITLRILFRPVPERLPSIFSNLGQDYDERVLPSIVNEVLKAVVVCIFLFYSCVYLNLCSFFCALKYVKSFDNRFSTLFSYRFESPSENYIRRQNWYTGHVYYTSENAGYFYNHINFKNGCVFSPVCIYVASIQSWWWCKFLLQLL